MFNRSKNLQKGIVQYKKLSSGHEIPLKGLGLFNNTLQGQQLEEFLLQALQVGYRHFDTAIRYGNEEQIGQAFNQILNNNNQHSFKREDIFLTTKVYPYKKWELIKKVEQSLENLQTDYIDLYLMHWSCVATDPQTNEILHKPVHQAWKELEKCVEIGYIKSIGVSNFNTQSLLDLLSYCNIKPAVNQIELHPYLQQPNLLNLCNNFDIHVTGYCSLARGGRLFEEPIVQQLAKKYNTLPSQVILNYLKNYLGISVIPKTQQLKRLSENYDFDNFVLEKSEVEQMKYLNKNERIVDPTIRQLFGFLPIFD